MKLFSYAQTSVEDYELFSNLNFSFSSLLVSIISSCKR
jgi:hypothetical protein